MQVRQQQYKHRLQKIYPNSAGIPYFLLLAVILFLAGLSACGDSSAVSGAVNPASASAVASLDKESDDDDDNVSENFRITEAEWDGEESELKVRGKGAPEKANVEIADAGSGAVLGVTEANRNGKWKFELANISSPPCRVKAAANALAAEKEVKNAPANCGTDDEGEPPPALPSHAGFYDTYEGSKTCNACHDQSVDVHASVHYQWNGPTPHVVNMDNGGKLGGINDFCGYPDINVIGLLTNLDGETVSGGCALCHIGMGSKPAAEATTAQLENIDCLICHSRSYRRKVERRDDGSFRFVPAPEVMVVPLLQAITDIQGEPTKGACVNCHSYAGGGCNNKRGDIEEAHRNPPSASFDVHMADSTLGGAGLNCHDCHITERHRVAGRGVDLRPTDLDVELRCTNCHASQPHGSDRLNRHTIRLDCSVCHIPEFAKITSTDMVRDYSKPPEIFEANRLYEPYIERAANVVPAYRFWNGMSVFYQFGAPFEPNENGRVLMAGPVGDITDPSAKIYPFKHHLAVLPYDVETKRLLPLKMGILFQTGDVDAAIRQGALEAGWTLNSGYGFTSAERFMGIFHEVSPEDDALTCNDCHGNAQRMDFAALGYTPVPARNPSSANNCASGCHGNKPDEWPPSEFFARLHDEHVSEENISCNECHNYY